MGGTIEVDTAPEKGTEYTVRGKAESPGERIAAGGTDTRERRRRTGISGEKNPSGRG